MPASSIARAAAALLDFVLPHRCLGCGTVVSGRPGFCSDCWVALPFLAGPACVQCALPFEVPVAPGTRCGQCLARPPHWSRAAAVWQFDGPARAAVLALKYGDRTEVVPHLVGLLARAGVAVLPDSVLVPVPLHRWRMARRTFNQSALLATALGRHTGQDVALRTLERVRATTPQQGLDRAARQANVRAAFGVNQRFASAIRGRNVVLIDDVYTTGATLDACARVLLRQGAVDVRVLTLARVVADAAKTIY
jgi:ComF family protein